MKDVSKDDSHQIVDREPRVPSVVGPLPSLIGFRSVLPNASLNLLERAKVSIALKP